MKVGVTPVDIAPGATQVTVPITFEIPAEADLFGVTDLTIHYDATVKSIPAGVTSRVATGALLSGFFVVVNVNTPGEIRVSASTATAVTGSGVALEVTFDLVGGGGDCSDLTFVGGMFEDSDLDALCADFTDGQCCIPIDLGTPALDAIEDASVTEAQLLTLPVSATDPDGDGLTLSAFGLPGFAEFTDDGDGSGQIEFTPGFGDAGVYEISVTATDDSPDEHHDTELFTLTVDPISPAECVRIWMPADAEALISGQVTIPVGMTIPEGRQLRGITDLLITYDPMVHWIPVGDTSRVVAGDLLSGFTIMTNVNVPGQIRITATSAGSAQGSGVAMELTFDVIGEIGACTVLDAGSAIYENDSMEQICSAFTDGQSCVVETLSEDPGSESSAARHWVGYD